MVSSAAFGPLCRLYRPASTVSVPFCLILACFVGFGVDLGKIFLDVRFLGDFVVTLGVDEVGLVGGLLCGFVAFCRCSLVFGVSLVFSRWKGYWRGFLGSIWV